VLEPGVVLAWRRGGAVARSGEPKRRAAAGSAEPADWHAARGWAPPRA